MPFFYQSACHQPPSPIVFVYLLSYMELVCIVIEPLHQSLMAVFHDFIFADNEIPPIEQSSDGYLNFSSIKTEDSGWYKCITRYQLAEYSSIGYFLHVRGIIWWLCTFYYFMRAELKKGINCWSIDFLESSFFGHFRCQFVHHRNLGLN